MSKKLFFLPVLMLLAITLIAPACGDKCEKKDCGTGTCDDVDGTCLCDAGYEYDADGSCKVKSQDKYVGTYTVSEVGSNSGPATFLAGIVAGATVTDISFTGFYGPAAEGGFQAAVKATIDGNVITIARQQPDNDNVFVVGSGTYDPATNKIALTYNVTDESVTPIVTNSCTATFSKQ